MIDGTPGEIRHPLEGLRPTMGSSPGGGGKVGNVPIPCAWCKELIADPAGWRHPVPLPEHQKTFCSFRCAYGWVIWTWGQL